jgi:hypothetical protein
MKVGRKCDGRTGVWPAPLDLITLLLRFCSNAAVRFRHAGSPDHAQRSCRADGSALRDVRAQILGTAYHAPDDACFGGPNVPARTARAARWAASWATAVAQR